MLKFAVIGYGYWGPNLARCASEIDAAALAGIADSSDGALLRAAKRHPGAKLWRDWREAVESPEVDAVMIATPVSSHFEIAHAALKAGKHVLVEKPMTSTTEESEILLAEAQKRNLTLMVDHTFVYTGAVRKIKEILDGGDIGDFYYYDSTRVNLGLIQHDVNVLWDLAVHDLSILDFLIEEQPTTVTACGSGHFGRSVENIAYLTLFYDSGAMTHLNVNWLSPVKIRQTLIGGSKKMIVYDDLQPSEKIKIYDRGVTISDGVDIDTKLRIGYRSGDMWAPQVSLREALMTEIEHFLVCVNSGSEPITGGSSGKRVVRILEAAMTSLRQRGAPISTGTLRAA
ncbi:MAG: Gfo/Idh/MocA family oxidoreductase [Chitinophagales bacterium]|nr:Gfo/Idh/MocA family oxidoreductase [Hyphomicrobiales bacterium]